MSTASCWGEGVCSEGAHRVAIKGTASLGEGVCSDVACRVALQNTANRMGGGIFAKTAKAPPLQSALRGYRCGGLPSTIICAHVGINGNGAEEDHDAACRVVIKNLPRVLL